MFVFVLRKHKRHLACKTAEKNYTLYFTNKYLVSHIIMIYFAGLHFCPPRTSGFHTAFSRGKKVRTLATKGRNCPENLEAVLFGG